MSIFGQVWLWSLLAFFVGVLVAWLVLVRPLRRRVREVEERLAQTHADAARTPANARAGSTATLSPVSGETSSWTRGAAPATALLQPAARGFDPESEYEAEYRTATGPAADDEVDEAFARADAEARDHDARYSSNLDTGLLGGDYGDRADRSGFPGAAGEQAYHEADRATPPPNLAGSGGTAGDTGFTETGDTPGETGFSDDGRAVAAPAFGSADQPTGGRGRSGERTTVDSGFGGADRTAEGARFGGVEPATMDSGPGGADRPGVDAGADRTTVDAGPTGADRAGADSGLTGAEWTTVDSGLTGAGRATVDSGRTGADRAGADSGLTGAEWTTVDSGLTGAGRATVDSGRTGADRATVDSGSGGADRGAAEAGFPGGDRPGFAGAGAAAGAGGFSGGDRNQSIFADSRPAGLAGFSEEEPASESGSVEAGLGAAGVAAEEGAAAGSFSQRLDGGPDYRAAATEYLSPAGQASDSGSHRIVEPDPYPADEHGSGYHRLADAEQSVLERRLDPAPVDGGGDRQSSTSDDADQSISLFQPASRTEPEPESDWFRRPDLPQRSPFEEPSDGHLAEPAPTDHLTATTATDHLAEPAATDHLSPANGGREPASPSPEGGRGPFASPEGGQESAFAPAEGGREPASPSPEGGRESAFVPAEGGYAPPAGPGVQESTVESADGSPGLPKRQPREVSPRGGFDAPRPIQPSMRPIERRDPELSGTQSGSLFEPSVRSNRDVPPNENVQPAQNVQPNPDVPLPPDVPPNQDVPPVQNVQPVQDAPEPPSARQSDADAVPVGPFGPGSAMPRPGGGRPADGFTVKASVTALRYCTEESPQFPRMVAEVWFRSAADAERVGFRPLH
ncbi:hypothetical protein GCM10022222_41920 [Amycolatopsis ultiminotia]|uniref:Uncharacterized protein n=1 Tax=Amycolatopsis ultiminotia TaxID=543629 RepID=A0ABP6WSA8_9PSEU